MESEFFFSPSTGLYVSKGPLKIDSRVKAAADNACISLQWDDEGRINFIDFDDARKLLSSLGAGMLSPIEYWKVLSDAKEANDIEMIKSLTSNKFCEWLDRVYLEDNSFIDHPLIAKKYKYEGSRKQSSTPLGRPGWFNPENNIDEKEGIPINVKLSREKFESSWKYWSPELSVTKLGALAPIRGYVTSVGKPSFDLGIPVDARQPVQMIRECRKQQLEPEIPLPIIQQAKEVIEEYSKIKKNKSKCLSFIKSNGHLFKKARQLQIVSLKEKLIDTLGALAIDANDKLENSIDISKAASSLADIKINESNYNSFVRFVQSSRARLKTALEENKNIVFVMGHKNPDTDTVVSALFEAWRNHLADIQKTVYMPIVQSYCIPDEIKKLLGSKISSSIILFEEKDYLKAKQSGLARWISVDQNQEKEVQRYFISIIDHHAPSEISKLQNIPKTIEIIGSCTALVIQKMLGMNMPIDKSLAKILHGATLMDTENRVQHKMTPKDKKIMDYLQSLSGIKDETAFYSNLMSALLNTDDPLRLFTRDYKEDWGFGFAVAKIKKGFSKSGKVLKPKLIKNAVKLAKQNNFQKNLPLTILRITDYEDNNAIINRERVYLIFNNSSSIAFKKSLTELLIKIVKFEFGKINIARGKDHIEFWGSGMQLSRKKTAPIIEPVGSAFNEYFYSPSNALWVKRDFIKANSDLSSAASSLNIRLNFDEEQRLHWVNYPEAKAITNKLGFSMLSLPQYWRTLKEAKSIKDTQMISTLQGSNFVEFLDSAILDYTWLIEHPKLSLSKKEFHLSGKKTKVIVPKGKPGLIHPDAVDLKTGIPKKVRKPNEYGNPELWRYWEPDANLVIPVRSYIFLLKQPCWDGKFHINDSFPNLGIRPCCKKAPEPKVNTSFDKEHLTVSIRKEGGTHIFLWKKGEFQGED